jgi:hypothetical protein
MKCRYVVLERVWFCNVFVVFEDRTEEWFAAPSVVALR